MPWTGRRALGAALAIGVGASLAFGKAGEQKEPAPAAESRTPSFSLRVMTYNIQHGYRHYPRTSRPWHHKTKRPRLRRTAKAIRSADPDILAVQEISRFHVIGSCRNQPRRLRRLLKKRFKHHVFGDNWATRKVRKRYKRCGRRKAGIGNAVFSRWPIVARGVRPLPRDRSPRVDRNARRGLMWATIKTPAGRVTVYNTHLASGRNARKLRMKQTRAIMRTIERRTERSTAVPLLLGDFNAGPRSPIVRKITEGPFTDAWSAATTDGRRAGRAGGRRTHRVGRIDHAFIPDDLIARKIARRDSRASDHRPVVADLRFRPATPGLR